MKIRQILEVKYVAPPEKEIGPKLPEELRTKHGLRIFLRDWKEKMREALWNEWMVGEYEDASFEDFYQNVVHYTPGRIRDVQKEFPNVPQLEEVYDEAFGEVIMQMEQDVEKDKKYAEHDEEW